MSANVDTSLPTGFESLEPFVERWLVATAAERTRNRAESSAAEREEFFNATKDFLPVALEELDKKTPSEFNDQESRLMGLLLSFAHVALAVEVQRDDESKQSELRKKMNLTRAIADQ